MRLLLKNIETVRSAVGSRFPVALKLNSSDQLEGGLSEQEAVTTAPMKTFGRPSRLTMNATMSAPEYG
nr:hypothetical protein [Cohaesibacter sp. CAU 1516]